MINSVAVGVYHTCSSDEVNWIVGNSDSKIVFLGNNPNDNDEKEKMPNHRLLAVLDDLNKVELVVTMDGVEKLDHEKIISWDSFIAKGNDISDSEVQKRSSEEMCREAPLDSSKGFLASYSNRSSCLVLVGHERPLQSQPMCNQC